MIEYCPTNFDSGEGSLTLLTENTLLFLVESDSSVQESVFTKLKTQIQNIFERAKEWFQKFQTERISAKVDQIVKEKISKDPSVADIKVRIPDNSKMIKLQEETLAELYRSRTEPEIKAKMDKYKRQRNKILVASAVITTTLGAALVILRKNNKETIDRLGRQNKHLSKQVEMYKDEVSDLSSKNEKLKKAATKRIRELKDEVAVAKAKTPVERSSAKMRKNVNKIKRGIGDATESVSDKAKTARSIVNASMQVVSEGIQDSKENVTETAKAILDPKTSVVKKAGAVVSGIKDQAGTIADVVTGETSKKASTKDSEQRIRFLRSAKKRYQDYGKIIKDPSRSMAERKNAKAKADHLKKIIQDVQQGGAIPKTKSKK